MNNWILVLLIISLSGCVTISEIPGNPVTVDQKSLTNISQVKTAMTYAEVDAIMGKTLVVGYEIKDPSSKILEPIAMANPVRIEQVTSADKKYFIVYYFTKVVKADQLISDDELTPVVFESTLNALEISKQDKLVGLGLDFVFRIKK